MFTLSADELRDMLPPRDSGGNKGTFGKVLVIAGTAGMCGAAVLCARACLRSGAGMVKVFTREENRIILQTALPEAMISTYSAGEREILREKMTDDLAWADVAVCGPGLGRDRDASFIVRALLDAAAAEETPVRGLVLDADALWLVGRHSGLSRLLQKRNSACACIMTPHPGELAALMDCTVGELDQDRSVPGREISALYRAVVCCKDARTAVVVPGREEVFLNVSGNSGMATAGSGDVLAGMAGAFLALGLNADKAAMAAVGLHGAAGDLCAREIGESGMIAGDIADRIPRTLQGDRS
jgi:NAD(P)H-hydrate epimerase